MKTSKVGRCVSAKCNRGGGGKKTKNGVKMTKKTGCEQIFHPNFSPNLKKDSIKRVLSCFIFKFHRRSTKKNRRQYAFFRGPNIDHMKKYGKKTYFSLKMK